MGSMQTRPLTKSKFYCCVFFSPYLFTKSCVRGLALLHSTSLDVQKGANKAVRISISAN
jgi:hypothetical protein